MGGVKLSFKNFYMAETSVTSLIWLAKVGHVTSLVLMNSKESCSLRETVNI